MAQRSARPGGCPSLPAARMNGVGPARRAGAASPEGLQAWRRSAGEAAPAACLRGDPCHPPVTAATAAPSSACAPAFGAAASGARPGCAVRPRWARPQPTETRHDLRASFRRRLRALPRLLADRPRHPRTADVRPPPASGRAGSSATARRRGDPGRPRRDRRDLRRHARRHQARTRPRRPALVLRQRLPPCRRARRPQPRPQRGRAAFEPAASRTAPR